MERICHPENRRGRDPGPGVFATKPYDALLASPEARDEPGRRLVFHVFVALAEFIRELIVQGTREGLAAARACGERIGRPPAMSAEEIRHAGAMLVGPEVSVSSIAKLMGVSRTTLYKYVTRAEARGWPSLGAASPAAARSR